jgi:hypothetical protein
MSLSGARVRVSRALVRLESSLQAKLTELEREAYIAFLLRLDPEIMEEAVENIVLRFRPERTRLPLPAEFLEFCPEMTRSQRERANSREARWRVEYETENRDGSVDRARDEFLRQMRALIGR